MPRLSQRLFRRLPATVIAAAACLAAVNGCAEAPAAPTPAPAAAAPEAKANVAERVAITARPAVVRIWSGCFGSIAVGDRREPSSFLSWGSGFFIHGDGYVMTNAHVVSDTKNGDAECAANILRRKAAELHGVDGHSGQEWFDWLVRNARVLDYERVAHVQLQTGKLLPFEIKEYGAPLNEGASDMRIGKDVAVLKVEIKNAPTLALGDSSKMKVGDRVWVIGYPGKAQLRGLMDEKSELQPNTTQGAISSTKATTDGVPVFGTDAPSAKGNSGGPALDENGNVIGLVTFGDPSAESFGYLVASNTAKEFVPHAASDTKGNQIDHHWREALDHYWRGEHADAKRKLKRVVDLQPEHIEAPRLIAELTEQHGDAIDEPAPAPQAKPKATKPALDRKVIAAAGAGAVFLFAAAVGAIFYLLARRRRLQAAPAPVAGYPAAPVAGYPAAPVAGYPAAPVAGYPIAPVPQPAAPPAQAARTMVYQGPVAGVAAKLTCTAGPLRGREFPIGAGLVIGRDPARAQIVVDDAAVSGAHLWIGPMDGRIVAMDCGSTNGTFLNERYQQRLRHAALGAGDVVTIGQPNVKFALVA
jgi:S1-C subfamily serine protease